MNLAMDLIREALLGGSGGGGGGVTVEQLNVTANGTYTAEEGKAYSPVVVNVGTRPSEPWKKVNFIDYDGTVLYSFTKADFIASSGLPANPSHERLVAEGWNWTRQQILDYMTACPGGEVIVGQTYTTASGDTEMDVVLKSRLSPVLGLGVNGSVTVNWGDGNSETVTGTSDTTRLNVNHTYASTGSYMITIHPDTAATTYKLISGSSAYTCFGDGTTKAGKYSYCAGVKAIRFGERSGAHTGCFVDLVNLEYVTMSKTTTLGNGLFSNNRLLKAVIFGRTGGQGLSGCTSLIAVSPFPGLNQGVSGSAVMEHYCIAGTNINGTAGGLTGAYGITKLYFPATVTDIGSITYQNALYLTELHFYSTTPPTIVSSSFTLASDCIIYVPSASLNDYQTANNWSAFASQMVGE